MKKGIISIAAISIALSSCTGNNLAKNYGGSETINLPKGQKLVNITWKDNSLWYLVRPMGFDEQPTTSIFQEKSAKGLVEGTVIIKESK